MKKLFSTIVSIAILMCTLIPSALAADTDSITLKVVDKNNTAVANARVYVKSDYGKWNQQASYTDKNGEIRLYDQSSKLNKPVNPKSTYTVTVAMRKVGEKAVKEDFTLKLATQKADSVVTVKLKDANTQAEVYKAKNRTDFYIVDSNGGPVCNMLVRLWSKSTDIPQTADAKAIISDDLYAALPPYVWSYTDNDGRATFLNLAADTYNVDLCWKGGMESKDSVKVDAADGVKLFAVMFDEKQLAK